MARIKLWLAGPRGWENPAPVNRVLRHFISHHGIARIIVVSGGAPGLDHIAIEEAQKLGIMSFECKALWSSYGHGAGPYRNEVIASEFRPDLLLAFRYLTLESHPGTLSATIMAAKYDIRTKIIKVRTEIALPSSISDSAPGAKARLRKAQEAKRAKRVANGAGKAAREA